MTVTINVILNLIQNQLDPDFRQDDGYVTVTGIILSVSWRIKLKSKAKELLTFDLQF